MSLFPRLETVITISYPLFNLFLDLTPEIIVETGNGFDKIAYYFGEFLDSYSVFDINLQSLIELYYLSAFVPCHPGCVLYKTRQILGD
jgi:hypothetical protein